MLVMPKFLTDLYYKAENLHGKRLILFVVPLFLCFVLIGLVLGNFIPQILNKNEVTPVEITPKEDLNTSTQFEGKVVYVDPRTYPLDNISFYLEDSKGNEIVLLKANDEKLTVVEGLNVIVFGKMEKTKDGENDVLMVERVVVKNK